jgi:hypothetical protein
MVIQVISVPVAYTAVEDSTYVTVTVIKPDSNPPMAVTNLNAGHDTIEGSVNLSWTAPHEDGTTGTKVSGYVIKYSTFSVSSLSGDTTTWWNHTETITGLEIPFSQVENPGDNETNYVQLLNPGVTYYFGIRSYDDASLWSDYDTNMYNIQASTTATDLIPVPPSGLTSLNVSTSSITLAWDNMVALGSNGYMDFDFYRIYRSSVSPDTNYISISTTTGINYIDYGIITPATYYYRIGAVDKPPLILESTSTAVEVYISSIIVPSDYIAPREPVGVKGIVSADRKSITVSWSEVTRNEDGTLCGDLMQYNIYRASTIDGDYTLAASTPAGTSLLWVEPEDIFGKTYYYTVRTQDNSGNESKNSMIVDSSMDMNVYAADIKNPCNYLSIPREIRDVLYKGNNPYNDDIKIILSRNETEETGRILKSYSFTAWKGNNEDTEEIINNFAFDKSLARVVLTYELPEEGASGGMRATALDEWSPENLSIFWFNGLDWIKLGGDVDTYFHTISINSKQLGKYIIKQSIRADSFTIDDTQPKKKIFTPNDDPWNAYFEIKYANPNHGSVNGKIYDLQGSLVATMTKGTTDGESSGSLKWDGKDFNGNVASGGVYIYQIEITGTENKILNGTCVLAK